MKEMAVKILAMLFFFSVITGCYGLAPAQKTNEPRSINTSDPGYGLNITETPAGMLYVTPSSLAGLEVMVFGCDTSIDVSHQLGEVTNAYVNIRNESNADYKSVCLTLNASDEGKPHPDKTRCVDNLQAGFEVTQKLTVDSTFQKETLLDVSITALGSPVYRAGFNCHEIQASMLERMQNMFGELRKYK
jgi:hypothetical protein